MTEQLDVDDIAAATLACLPGMTPARLHRLHRLGGGFAPALAMVRAGGGGAAIPVGARGTLDPRTRAATLARWTQADPDAVAATLRHRGTRVTRFDHPGYPIADDIADRPAVLLIEGDADDALARPRVAMVGTRSATPHGLADARELAETLADRGITVVSGLAIGIDAAAHEGALATSGTTIGVIATGLDIVYPRRHASLTAHIRARGLVVSESGFGVGAQACRFPVRNRIIAGLADVTVVVEATARGGARITAEHALGYGRPVLAIPGARRNAAAAGCNELLADGAHPLLEPDDVVVALGLTPGVRRRSASHPAPRPPRGTPEAIVLEAFRGEPAHPDDLAARAGLSAGAVALALAVLERAGSATRAQGFWWPA